MELKDDAIVLRLTRYGDRRAICTLLTRSGGQMACGVSLSATASGRRFAALLSPGARLSVVMSSRGGSGSLPGLREAVRRCGSDLSADALSAMTAAVLADVVRSLTADHDADESLFAYVDDSMAMLPELRPGAMRNFPIAFLSGLTYYLGVAPDVSGWREGCRVFDMRDGVFRLTAPLHGDCLEGEEGRGALLVAWMNPGNCHLFRLDRVGRVRALDLIVRYLKLHLTQGVSTRALDVVRMCLS